MAPTPGIFFRIDLQTSRQIREWIDELDWQYIKHRIGEIGSCMVAKIKPDPGKIPAQVLENVPEKAGIYRPLMSVIGGEVTYRFRPQGKTVMLHIKTLYVIPNIADCPGRTMTLNQHFEHQAVTNGNEIMFTYARLKDGDNLFGFSGEFFDIFHAWEYYSEDFELFEFEFQPLSIGCGVSVIHLASGEKIHLTANVEW